MSLGSLPLQAIQGGSASQNEAIGRAKRGRVAVGARPVRDGVSRIAGRSSSCVKIDAPRKQSASRIQVSLFLVLGAPNLGHLPLFPSQ